MRANLKISSRRHAEVIEEHVGILAACRNRDAEAAVALTSQHLEKALRLTLYG
jgi:DNA-binding GntR family transcriptional regulator